MYLLASACTILCMVMNSLIPRPCPHGLGTRLGYDVQLFVPTRSRSFLSCFWTIFHSTTWHNMESEHIIVHSHSGYFSQGSSFCVCFFCGQVGSMPMKNMHKYRFMCILVVLQHVSLCCSIFKLFHEGSYQIRKTHSPPSSVQTAQLACCKNLTEI